MNFDRRKFIGMMTGGLAGTKLSGQEKPKLEIKESQNEDLKFVEDLRKIAEDLEIPILLKKIKKQIDDRQPKETYQIIYGSVNYFLDINKKIKDLLERLKEEDEKIADTVSRFKRLEIEINEKDIDSTQGTRRRILKQLRGLYQYAFPENKKDAKLEITGFENLKDWSDERVRKIMATLPKDIFSDIESIDFINQDEKNETMEVAAAMNSEPHWNSQALFWLGVQNKRINIFRVDYQDEDMANTLSHEAGHSVDWWHSYRLNFKQRVEFLSDVIDLYTSHQKASHPYPDDRVYGEFVAMNKKFKNRGVSALLLHQVTEYWAVLVEKYVNSKKQYKKSPEDYAQNVVGLTTSEEILVEKWMKNQGINLNN